MSENEEVAYILTGLLNIANSYVSDYCVTNNKYVLKDEDIEKIEDKEDKEKAINLKKTDDFLKKAATFIDEYQKKSQKSNNIQEKINHLAKITGKFDKIYSDEEEIYGKLEKVIEELNNQKEFLQSGEYEGDEESRNDYLEQTNSLIQSLSEKYKENDFIYLVLNPMSDFYEELDSSKIVEYLELEIPEESEEDER